MLEPVEGSSYVLWHADFYLAFHIVPVIFQGSGAGGPPVWVIDVGDDSPHGQVPGYFSSQRRQADYRDTAEAKGGWYLGITTAGDSDGEGGV